MSRSLQFTGFMVAMALGVLISVKPTAGSVSEPGGQGVPCDVNFKPQEHCPSSLWGLTCEKQLDMAGNHDPDKKLASSQSEVNCSQFLDDTFHACANIPEIRILVGYNCETAPPPPL